MENKLPRAKSPRYSRPLGSTSLFTASLHPWTESPRFLRSLNKPLDKIISEVLEMMGCSEKTKKETLAELEKIIAVRFFLALNKKLSNPLVLDPKNLNLDQLVQQAKNKFSQEEINNLLIQETQEVAANFLGEVSKIDQDW